MFGIGTSKPVAPRRQISGRVERFGVRGNVEFFGYTIQVEGHKAPFHLAPNDRSGTFQYVELTQPGDLISFSADSQNRIIEFKNAALGSFTRKQ